MPRSGNPDPERLSPCAFPELNSSVRITWNLLATHILGLYPRLSDPATGAQKPVFYQAVQVSQTHEV